jgi:hypothetical protein
MLRWAITLLAVAGLTGALVLVWSVVDAILTELAEMKKGR